MGEAGMGELGFKRRQRCVLRRVLKRPFPNPDSDCHTALALPERDAERTRYGGEFLASCTSTTSAGARLCLRIRNC
jgi:hypothetical protein